MATTFADWVSEHRERLGYSKARLAREVARSLSADWNRDKQFELERGSPKNPPPDLVKAEAHALGRPIREALEAFGYELPDAAIVGVDETLLSEVRLLSVQEQQSLAQLLPALLELGVSLASRHQPLAPPPMPVDNRRKSPWKRAGEERSGEHRTPSEAPS